MQPKYKNTRENNVCAIIPGMKFRGFPAHFDKQFRQKACPPAGFVL